MVRFVVGMLVGLVCCWEASALAAESIAWKQDFREAAAEAARSRKPMLVKVSTSWCTYCKKMMRETFTDQEVAEHINGCFVPVMLDGDEQKALVQRMGVTKYPTTVIISPDMKIVEKLTGFKNAAQMKQHLSSICNHTAQNDRAQQEPPFRQASTEKPAFEGYCLVSMLDDERFAGGSPKFALSYRGQTLFFASEEHRKRFQANPKRYWPIADGRCLVSMMHERANRSGEAGLAVIHRDHLFFFASPQHQQAFFQQPESYVR